MLTTLLLSPHTRVNMFILGAMDCLLLVQEDGLLLLLPHLQPTQYLVNILTTFRTHPKHSNGASQLANRQLLVARQRIWEIQVHIRLRLRLPPGRNRSIQSTGPALQKRLPIPLCSPPGKPHSLRHRPVLGCSKIKVKILQLINLVLSMGFNLNLGTTLAMQVHPMPHHLDRHNHRRTLP